MKKTFKTKVQIVGKGKSKEMAINSALGSIQKKVMDTHKGLILRIEPLDILVLEAKETEYTERFLLLFFPRKRKQYEVILEIEVHVFLLDVEEIQFEKEDRSDNMRSLLLGHQINK